MDRIYHTWDKWECYPAGFYESKPKDRSLSDDECREPYRAFLADIPAFEAAMAGVLQDWPRSCEHYLSNENMNRIAWLGQAALCYAHGIPAVFRGGFNRLTPAQQHAADAAALGYLNRWLTARGEPALTLDEASSKTKANLY
jgi:hypothetical protein